MSKMFFDIIKDSDKDEYVIASFAINFILIVALLVYSIIVNPIVFLLWLPYKIFTMLLAYFIIFNTLKNLKNNKIIKENVEQTNSYIKYISDSFIIYILFSNTLLFAFIFYSISNLSKFKWEDFVKNIKTKSEDFNNFISNKIQNKFLIKEQEEPEIIKESYRD